MNPDDFLPRIGLSAIGVGLVVADAEGIVVHLNSFAERMIGWSQWEARGRRIDEILSLCSDVSSGRLPFVPDTAASNGGPQREEALLIRRDGQRLPVELAVSVGRTLDGLAGGVTVVFTDISEQRLMAAHLARAAGQDLLTGLLNRTVFVEHMAAALEDSRERSSEHAVCFLDVDQFKLINTTCGHEAGDDLLQWVAALLREAVESRDAVARLGGDEFALLLTGYSLPDAVRFVRHLQDRLQDFVFTWREKTFTISASVGLVPFGPRFQTAAQLLSAADQACYMAKDLGRGGIQVYERHDVEVGERRSEMDWMARISRQLQEGNARLYAQSMRRLTPGPPQGVQLEALLRLSERGGRVQHPGRLIRAAERYGLMPSIDRWVIRRALRQLRGLGRDGLRRIHLCFINLSGLSLRDDSVLDFIRDQLAASGIPPHKLGFEITETAAVQDLEHARWFIQELASIGCRLALDDFGTGFASYSYLKKLPVEYVKIDGGFVEAMTTSALDRAMVESINQISHVLGLKTVAESVESRELLGRVRDIGIDYAQGYWIDRPRPFEQTCTAA